jgi:two-component system sensor histidine kinase TtrS
LNIRHLRIWTLSLLLFLGQSLTTAAADEVRIGVLAKRGYEKSLQKWEDTAGYLNQTLPQHRFKIVPMRFDDIQVIVKNKLVDFVIVNPGIYVDLSVKYGVNRILTLVNELSEDVSITKFGSVIFTAKANQEINNLADLKNRRLSAVHPTSLGGWIMALREMKNAGIETWDLASLSYLNTHDAVVNAVISRETDVGVVRTDTLERMAREGKLEIDQVRIINPEHYNLFPYTISTPLYPEWPFAQLQHTPQQLAKDVTIALLKLPPDHAAAKNAHIRGWTIPENYQATEDLLRQLELSPFDTEIREQLLESFKQYWYFFAPGTLMLLFLALLSIRIVRLNRSLSEHKHNLIQSELAQIATFEQAAVGLAHISSSGQLFNMNQRLCTITGHSKNALLHTNLMDLIMREDIAPVTHAFDTVKPGKENSAVAQFRLRRADNSLNWCQLTLSCETSSDNKTDLLIAVIDDIDHYKKLEEEKLSAENQKKLILNLAEDGIIGLDSEGKHTFVNPAALQILGYPIDEMIQQESHCLWHHSHLSGNDYQKDNCPILNVLKTGEVYHTENDIFWHKDGTAVEVEYICTPINMDEAVTGAVIVFRPIEPIYTSAE